MEYINMINQLVDFLFNDDGLIINNLEFLIRWTIFCIGCSLLINVLIHKKLDKSIKGLEEKNVMLETEYNELKQKLSDAEIETISHIQQKNDLGTSAKAVSKTIQANKKRPKKK